MNKIGSEMPITNALSFYLSKNRGKKEVLMVEYRNLLEEFLLKFSLLIDSGTIRGAAETLKGILSLGLLIITKGSQDHDRVSKAISRHGLTGLVKAAIVATQEYSEKYHDSLSENLKSLGLGVTVEKTRVREVLMKYANSKTNGIWRGYHQYIFDLKVANNELLHIGLADWLKQYCRDSAESKKAGYTNPEIAKYLLPDELVNIVLFRVAFNKKPSITISREGVSDICSKYKGKKSDQQIRSRLINFLSKVPEKLRGSVNIDDFCNYYVEPILREGNASHVKELLVFEI